MRPTTTKPADPNHRRRTSDHVLRLHRLGNATEFRQCGPSCRDFRRSFFIEPVSSRLPFLCRPRRVRCGVFRRLPRLHFLSPLRSFPSDPCTTVILIILFRRSALAFLSVTPSRIPRRHRPRGLPSRIRLTPKRLSITTLASTSMCMILGPPSPLCRCRC